MIDPHNPQVKGDSETIHDGMSDKGHEQQANRANGSSMKSDESHED